MNKKFSTLVASLLVSSTFGVYNVGAVPVLANQTQIETRATLPAEVEDAVEWPGTLNAMSILQSQILPGFTNNARMYMVRQNVSADLSAGDLFVKFDTRNTINQPLPSAYPTATPGGTLPVGVNEFYWSLRNGQLVDNAGHVFTVNGASLYFEVIPVKTSADPTAPTYYFVLGTRNSDGSLSYVNFSSSRFDLTSNLADAITFCSIETEYNANIPADELNDELGDGNGFNVTISSKEDADAEIVGADIFDGTIVASNPSSINSYELKVGNKWIVFDTNEDRLTSDPNTLKGQFKLVDDPDATGLVKNFCVSTADNGSDEIIIKVNVPANLAPSELTTTYPSSTSFPYRLYISNTAGTYGLGMAYYYSTAPDMNVIDWAAVTIGDNKIVDLREFLTGDFYTVDFVEATTPNNNNEYKKGGRLAVRETRKADYVDASSLYSKAPEAQWAISGTITEGVNEGKPYFNDEITLTNRENPAVSVTIKQLRRVDGVGFLVEDVTPTTTGLKVGDIVRINAVANHDKHDGYEVFSDNDLRNETYYLGQIRQAEGEDINVYWAENHAASHQIGATVEQANATKWNLSLVKKDLAKDHESEVDSVLVISELQQWNPTKNRIDVQPDTLVILPYAFQNRSNNEFAQFNNGTNLKYYQCDADNKKDGYVYSTDAMFALKRKADINGEPVYNYVALKARKAKDYTAKGWVPTTTEGEWYATEKVYQENSTDHGTWKNMKMYDGDANALMFVTKVEAPEYRKLVTTAALDTIKLYRADNEAQVVYEKRDDKSVVDGRTLSFLNIDNDTQFTDINPALYADTAYVNRGNNTCWQYLLGVNIEHVDGYYCPTHGFAVTPPCEHAKPVSYNTGRYLINMIDTANVYGQTAGIHNNPYINETEEGMDCAKLSFVDAIHVLTDPMDETAADKLYVINGTEEGDTVAIDLSTPNFNIAKFAFKYMDFMNSDEFKIQTLWKQYAPGTKEADLETSQEGYLRWVNGCIVVDKTFQKGDVFNMDENETRTPTANEEISAEAGAVSVVATDGAIIVKGAEGKNVVVATILGKVVANEVATSDNETIAVPAGIAVVAVDGESFKVVVK